MGDLLIQRLVRPPRVPLAPLYYRVRGQTKPAPESNRLAKLLPPGAVLGSDTYFNAFFEDYWRAYTRLGRLDLKVRTSGTGSVEVFRRLPGRKRQLVAEASFSGERDEVLISVPEPRAESG